MSKAKSKQEVDDLFMLDDDAPNYEVFKLEHETIDNPEVADVFDNAQLALFYTKAEILRYYSTYHDYLTVRLKDDLYYTVAEVDTIIKEVN